MFQELESVISLCNTLPRARYLIRLLYDLPYTTLAVSIIVNYNISNAPMNTKLLSIMKNYRPC